MAHKHIISILSAVMILVVVSGCQETSRIDRVRPRWQRTIEQARLDAAEQSLEAGETAFAERLLSVCQQSVESESRFAGRIERLRTRLQAERHSYARAGDETADPEETAY